MTSAIDGHLARARQGISILNAHEAAALRDSGALLIDTRPVAQRLRFGEIPGSGERPVRGLEAEAVDCRDLDAPGDVDYA